MQIEEWRPDPLPPPPPAKPLHKYRSAIIKGTALLAVFVLTLTVLARHELAEYIRQRAAESTSQSVMAKKRVLPPLASFSAGKLSRNTMHALACIPDSVLNAAEREQLAQVLIKQPELAESVPTLETESMTARQADDFSRRLSLVWGELGEKARAAFSESTTNGPCKATG